MSRGTSTFRDGTGSRGRGFVIGVENGFVGWERSRVYSIGEVEVFR